MSTGIAFGCASAMVMAWMAANLEAHATAVAVSAEEFDCLAGVATLSVEPGCWIPSESAHLF